MPRERDSTHKVDGLSGPQPVEHVESTEDYSKSDASDSRGETARHEKRTGRRGTHRRRYQRDPKEAQILKRQQFLSQLKKADVIFIPKPDKNNLCPSNYRPINLVPVMSKVAKRIILARTREQMDALHVLSDEQFAYRISHYTKLQVLTLVESITKGFNRNLVTIYMSDLPRTERTSLALFADDTAMIAQSTQAAHAMRQPESPQQPRGLGEQVKGSKPGEN